MKSKIFLPIFILFIVLSVILFALKLKFVEWHINFYVVFAANCLLFTLSAVALLLHIKALKQANPNAVVRSMIGVTGIKMLVLASAALIYLLAAGKDRSVFAVLAGMALYFPYLILEVKTALKFNKNPNGGD
jgi:hypothetical protein